MRRRPFWVNWPGVVEVVKREIETRAESSSPSQIMIKRVSPRTSRIYALI